MHSLYLRSWADAEQYGQEEQSVTQAQASGHVPEEKNALRTTAEYQKI